MNVLSRWDRLLLAVDGTVEVAGVGRPGPRSARDWIVDGALFGFAALAAISLVLNVRGDIGAGLLALDAALAVPACLALWLRRRAPTAVAGLAVTASAVSQAAVHAGQVAVFSAAIHARPRRAVAVTLAAVAANAVVCAIYPATGGRAGFESDLFVGWSAMAGAAFAFGSFVRVRRQLVARLRAEQELRVHDARMTERTRIAREMHDVLAHRISLLSVHAGALEVRPDAPHDEIARAAHVIRVSARAAQEDLREVLGVLRTDPEGDRGEPPQPTLDDLGVLVEESRRAGLVVTLEDALAGGPAPPALTGRTAFRVVQEALTNARKHAPAQPVTVALRGAPGDVLVVEVENRPVAGVRAARPPEHVGSGVGLIGLAERLALAGGTLEHGALPGGGFAVRARIAWPEGEA